MAANIIVIDKEGKQISLTQWQKKYGLPLGGDHIGKYFSLNEDRFQRDLMLYNQLIINEQLMRVTDQFREDVGRPLTANAFNRSAEHQVALGKQGLRTATISPHVFYKVDHIIHGCIAIDVDTKSDEQTNKEVLILKASAKKLGIKIRVGYKEYQEAKQTFIHFDVGPEYYAKGKPWNHLFHPKAWENEITW